MMTEKHVEAALRRYAKERGVLFLKFTSPGNAGVPDRILIGPTGKIAFLELKRPGESPRPLQLHWLKVLNERGCVAGWTSSVEEGKRFINEIL